MAEVQETARLAFDIKVLKEAKRFTVVFADDKGFRCSFAGADNYNRVSSPAKRVMTP
jgi:hypothetical protein